MVRSTRTLGVFVLLFSMAALFGERVTCTVSKQKISIQEQVQITFTFEDIKNSPSRIDLDLGDAFDVVGGPYSSSNYSWINGKSTSTNKISYDLVAKKTGKLLIPAHEFKIKNKLYKTEPVTLLVRKAAVPDTDDPSASVPDIFFQTHLSKKKVYQGETFSLTYYLYTAESVLNYTTSPLTGVDGFIIDKFDMDNSPSSSKKIINGKEYLIAAIARLTLTPTSSGKFAIPPKPFRISVKQATRSRSIFDDPFFGGGSKDINIVAPGDTVTVLPLPAGAGAAFTGAIGEFDIRVSIDSTVIQENQATSLTVELNGHGNLEHFAFPEQIFPDAFEVFEPKTDNAFQLNERDYRGKRSWEYVLIPSAPGTFRFDDIRFTYFSPEKGRYVTLVKPLPELRVISHNELAGDYNSGLSPEEVRVLSKDIRFIQMDESRILDKGHNPLKEPKNWFFYYLSAGLLLVFIFLELAAKYRKVHLDKIRYRNAFKNAASELNKINDEQPSPTVLAEIELAFLNYIDDKQVRDEVYPDIEDVKKTIETYKYAPGMLSHAQLNKLKDRTIELIGEIEKNEE